MRVLGSVGGPKSVLLAFYQRASRNLWTQLHLAVFKEENVPFRSEAQRKRLFLLLFEEASFGQVRPPRTNSEPLSV